MLSAERIIENIRIRTEGSLDPILVFWCQVLTNRDEMREQISDLKGEMNLVPIVLRGSGFEHPNAILSDLNQLIRQHKEEFEQGAGSIFDESKPLILLLLSRTQFSLPQIASLITLPEWFPRAAGQNVFLLIQDLTATGDAPINASETRISDIAERLFNLEVGLVNRMRSVAINNKHAGQQLFQFINPNGKGNYQQFLDSATKYHGEVQNPSAFRPSVRETRCLNGRLINLMRITTPDQISNRAKALAVALGLPEEINLTPESLITVLLRPTNKETAAIRFARNLIVTAYASAQFITASAHADDFGRYPILLLRSFSYDLRVGLESLTRIIKSLPEPTRDAD